MGRRLMPMRFPVLLIAIILSSWLLVGAQPETPVLAVEVVQGRFPAQYIQVPALGASSSFTWDAEVGPENGLWTAGLLSFQLASPDSLRVQLSRAELSSPVPTPPDFNWKREAEYSLPLKEGATLTSPGLAALHIRQIRIVSAKSPDPHPPEVIERSESLEVFRIAETIRNWYTIELLNVSKQPIRGIFSRDYRGEQWIDADHAGSAVQPGETLKITMYSTGDPHVRLEVGSVLFEDGNCEGAPGGCARIEARREGRLLGARLHLAILQPGLANPDVLQLLEALSGIAVANRSRSKLIEQLTLRYPGSIDKDLDRIVDDFAAHLTNQGLGLRQTLERLASIPGSGKQLETHIREQIRQCEQSIARGGWQ